MSEFQNNMLEKVTYIDWPMAKLTNLTPTLVSSFLLLKPTAGGKKGILKYQSEKYTQASLK